MVALVAALALASVGVAPVGASGPAVVSIGEVSAPEGDAGAPLAQSVKVPITLSEAQGSDTLVTWIVSGGSASAGSDFKAVPSPRTTKIKAGKTRGFATVTLYGDTDPEADETVSLTVTAVSGSGAVLGDPTGSVTIVDDDFTVTGGNLWAWGFNGDGELGVGDYLDRDVPTPVGADTDWASVAAGDYYTVAVKTDGTLWAWGYNGSGQLGTGDYTSYNAPTQVGTDTDWQSVAASDDHTVAVKSDGTLWAWGSNSYGQLGLGDTVDRDTPTQVGTDTDWASVSAGYLHTVAVKADGTLWAWGSNGLGQLGLGDTVDRHVPTQVGSDTDWASVTAGFSHTVAVKTTGGGGS